MHARGSRARPEASGHGAPRTSRETRWPQKLYQETRHPGRRHTLHEEAGSTRRPRVVGMPARRGRLAHRSKKIHGSHPPWRPCRNGTRYPGSPGGLVSWRCPHIAGGSLALKTHVQANQTAMRPAANARGSRAPPDASGRGVVSRDVLTPFLLQKKASRPGDTRTNSSLQKNAS